MTAGLICQGFTALLDDRISKPAGERILLATIIHM